MLYARLTLLARMQDLIFQQKKISLCTSKNKSPKSFDSLQEYLKWSHHCPNNIVTTHNFERNLTAPKIIYIFFKNKTALR